MSRFREKVFGGESIVPNDWSEYLKEAHKNAPGMAPDAFAKYKNAKGFDSMVGDARLNSVEGIHSVFGGLFKNIKVETFELLVQASGEGFTFPMRLVTAEKSK